MARQYLYLNGQQIPLNGQDFWVGTHEQFENANPPIPKGTLLYFTDGDEDWMDWTPSITHESSVDGVTVRYAMKSGKTYMMQIEFHVNTQINSYNPLMHLGIPLTEGHIINASVINRVNAASVTPIYMNHAGSMITRVNMSTGTYFVDLVVRENA